MRKAMLVALVGVTAAMPAAAVQAPVTQPIGVWMNPHATVAVRTGPCGEQMCGWVVWASAGARADARGGGVAQLVGTKLLENYRPEGHGTWTGTVFVPDMGRHFSSVIDQVAPDRLQVKGCVLGGLICKTQVWTRTEHLPDA